MTKRILVSAPYFIPVLDDYREVFERHDLEPVVPDVEERLEEDELLELIPGIHGAVCGDDRFTERVLAEAGQLEVIAKWGTGIDSIDTEAAASRGVGVYNTPDAFTDPVADTAMGYILAFARRIPWMDDSMKDGAWEKQEGHALHEATLGVVGVGNIGSAVLERATAFGMETLGNDVVDVPEPLLEATATEMVGKDELLARSDYVSLHCDLNPRSRGIIGSKELERMKETAVLVNTARGPLVDEQALLDALQVGSIRGAALDVFEEEPLPEDSPLRSMDNVLLAAHNANASPTAWEHVHENTLANLLEGLGITKAVSQAVDGGRS